MLRTNAVPLFEGTWVYPYIKGHRGTKESIVGNPFVVDASRFQALDMEELTERHPEALMSTVIDRLFLPSEIAISRYHVQLNYLSPVDQGVGVGGNGLGGEGFRKFKKDVTLVTQLSSRNFLHLSVMMKLWGGPMSISGK